MKGKLLLLLSCFIVSISLIGCVENMTDTQKGAAIGAAAGVV